MAPPPMDQRLCLQSSTVSSCHYATDFLRSAPAALLPSPTKSCQASPVDVMRMPPNKSRTASPVQVSRLPLHQLVSPTQRHASAPTSVTPRASQESQEAVIVQTVLPSRQP